MSAFLLVLWHATCTAQCATSLVKAGVQINADTCDRVVMGADEYIRLKQKEKLADLCKYQLLHTEQDSSPCLRHYNRMAIENILRRDVALPKEAEIVSP